LNYRDDEEFARFLPHVPQPFTLADAEKFVETNMSEPWDRYPTFAVVFNGTLIGTVNLEVNARDRIAMVGYAIGREHWGIGITPEAARVVIKWGFETFDLAKIWASTDAEHVRSRRVMEKLGMRLEGTLRGHSLGRNGARRDDVVYGMLREEWDASESN
jgi:ribosomal-protein-alanine N-acetyltransferase